ncbi:MAG: ABC transporter permease [Parvibaculaceae bacterium]
MTIAMAVSGSEGTPGKAGRASVPGRLLASLLRDRWSAGASAIIALFVLCAIFAPWLAPYAPTRSDIDLRLLPPFSPGHWLGVDTQGRDVLSRLIYGTRVSLVTGLVPVAVSAVIAVPLGLVAGYFDRLGVLVMRAMDILFAFPMVLLAILLSAILGPGLVNMTIALVLVLLPFNTRIIYVETLKQKGASYVEAAEALGTPGHRIMFRELFPHVAAAGLVYSFTIIGTMIVTAAGLSFLGLGVQPPEADWGLMTSEGRAVLYIAPHIATAPGIAIFLLVTAFNLMGDALRDALDPKSLSR